MKKLKIDVMLMGGGKFYKTIIYQYNPLFMVKEKDIKAFILKKLPSLKKRKDVQYVVY